MEKVEEVEGVIFDHSLFDEWFTIVGLKETKGCSPNLPSGPYTAVEDDTTKRRCRWRRYYRRKCWQRHYKRRRRCCDTINNGAVDDNTINDGAVDGSP